MTTHSVFEVTLSDGGRVAVNGVDAEVDSDGVLFITSEHKVDAMFSWGHWSHVIRVEDES